MASIYDPNLMSIIVDYAYPPWENMLVLLELESLFRGYCSSRWGDIWSFPHWWILHPLAKDFAETYESDYDYSLD